MTARNLRPPDPQLVERLVAGIVASVPGLDAAEARSALPRARINTGAVMRQLDAYLREHPRVLHEPGPRPPLQLVRLANILADAGHPVTRPCCNQCGVATIDLPHIHENARTCGNCARINRARPCARCGQARPITAGRQEGGICARCRRHDRLTLDTCGGCGNQRQVIRRRDGVLVCQGCNNRPPQTCVDCGHHTQVQAITSGGPVCANCYHRHQPRRTCGRCGRLRRIAARATDATPDLCTGCYRGKEDTCTVCGRVRPGFRHPGGFRCRGCIPRPLRICARCGQRRTVQAEWPLGPVCAGCYNTVRYNPATCAGCGTLGVLTGRNSHGEQVCGPCAGVRGYACAGCGRPGYPDAKQRCSWCVLAERVHDLLTGPDGQVPVQLTPLQAILTETDQPDRFLAWLRRAPCARLLTALATDPQPVSHDLLDQLPPTQSLHHLRQVLILNGLLEPRDEHLARLSLWLQTFLAELPTSHLPLLRPFAHWNILHRARRRAQSHGPTTAGGAARLRTYLRAATNLLTWLDEGHHDLAQLDQRKLDQYLITTRDPTDLRRFIKWTNQRELTRSLHVPDRPRSAPHHYLTDEQRWEQLQQCLHNQAIPTNVRVAGALILLLGVRTTQVLALTVNDIAGSGTGQMTLRFGDHPIQLPPRLAALIEQLLGEHPKLSASHRRDGPLPLFPGRPPTRPLNTSGFSQALNTHGINPHPGRNAALIDLLADLPAPVVADILGMHPVTAVRWSALTKRDWATYLAARDQPERPDRRPLLHTHTDQSE